MAMTMPRVPLSRPARLSLRPMMLAALPVDVGAEGVGGDAAQPADVDGLDLRVGQQLVEQAATDAELLGGLGDGEQEQSARSCSGRRPVLLSVRAHLLRPSVRVRA
jgi:hypothetical protein